MWRMYLNEELSRVILGNPKLSDQSKTVDSVTSSYVNHPDGKKYGRQMKRLFRSGKAAKSFSLDNLSDNMYLVYGLPRVSLTNHTPVKQLHQSVCNMHQPKLQNGGMNHITDDAISEMFKFITHERLSESEDSGSSSGPKYVRSSNTELVKREPALQRKESRRTQVDIHSKRDESSVITSSKILWNEKLDAKQVNRKELKSALPKRSSKLLWQTIRERKSDIIRMHTDGRPHIKPEPSKTSQLWSFIFSKKKDLIRMKRNMKQGDENHKPTKFEVASERFTPCNFEDPFQRELQQKLQARANRNKALAAED